MLTFFLPRYFCMYYDNIFDWIINKYYSFNFDSINLRMKIISKISFGHELFFLFILTLFTSRLFFLSTKKTVKNKTFIKPFYNSFNATFESPGFKLLPKQFFVVELWTISILCKGKWIFIFILMLSLTWLFIDCWRI